MTLHSRLLPLLLLVTGACSTPAELPMVEEVAARLWPQGIGVEPAAGDGAGPPAELESFLRAVQANNPRLRAAFEKWRAGLAAAGTKGWLPEPKLTWAHFIDSIQTRTGPQRNRFSLMQAFPWPGKLGLQEKAALSAAQGLRHALEETRLDLVRLATRAWAEYSYLGRALELEREMLVLLKQLEPVVQKRIQGGGGQADLLRLQLEVGRREDRLASLVARRPALGARLWSLLGRRSSAPWPWPRPAADGPLPTLPAPERLEQLLLAANPSLRISREQVARAEHLRELADLAGRPDFTLGATLFETGGASMPGVEDSGEDPLAVSLTLSLPLWASSYAAARRSAQAGLEAARRSLARRRNDLSVSLAEARWRVEDRRRQVELYRATLLPRARQALALATRAYQADKAGFLDLVDRQQLLLSFELALCRARTDLTQSLADLAALCGGSLP